MLPEASMETGNVMIILIAYLICLTSVLSKPTDTSCDSLVEQDSCELFTCIDKHNKCLKSRGFRHSILNTFCKNLQRYHDYLTPKGQDWADDSMSCVMLKVTELSEQTDICTDFSKQATDVFDKCLGNSNAICTVLQQNLNTLLKISGKRYWMYLVRAASHCPRHDVTRIIMAYLGV